MHKERRKNAERKTQYKLTTLVSLISKKDIN